MVLHESNFTQLTDLDPVLNTIYYQEYEVAIAEGGTRTVDSMQGITVGGVMQLFGIAQSSKAKETDLHIDSFSDPVVFNGKVTYESPDRGYEVEYTHEQYTKGFAITRAMIDDMQYDGIFASAAEMGTAFARKMRKDAASVFNNAFTTAGFDGVSLCNNAHPRSLSASSTTVDNSLALPLTSDNLETAIITMQQFKDTIGEEITIRPNTLVVPYALRKTAIEITGSDLQPETANNAINVHQGMGTIVDPYLTDPNAWFVVDSTMARRNLRWFNRVLPEFGVENDFDTLIRRFRGYMRYSFGWSDWRWLIGSNPS